MKILVTGSSGHLGEALIRTLRASNEDVVGCDLLPSPFTDYLGSITDSDFVNACLRGVNIVYHTATLHKPHVATHTRQQFVDTNITGTLNLLEESRLAGVNAFVFTSTTSLFGDAMQPGNRQQAVWVTEELTPVLKNIYGVTKQAAEDLCQLFHSNQNMNCIILRTSRFFPEEDDQREVRDAFSDANIKANEYLFRRAAIDDIVSAHLCAAEKAAEIGFGRYIISATTPFTAEDLPHLMSDPAGIVARYYPAFQEVYERQGWRMFDQIGRVYVNAKARKELGWAPEVDFGAVLKKVDASEDFLTPLARQIGRKGYHDETFEDGLYPVE